MDPSLALGLLRRLHSHLLRRMRFLDADNVRGQNIVQGGIPNEADRFRVSALFLLLQTNFNPQQWKLFIFALLLFVESIDVAINIANGRAALRHQQRKRLSIHIVPLRLDPPRLLRLDPAKVSDGKMAQAGIQQQPRSVPQRLRVIGETRNPHVLESGAREAGFGHPRLLHRRVPRVILLPIGPRLVPHLLPLPFAHFRIPPFPLRSVSIHGVRRVILDDVVDEPIRQRRFADVGRPHDERIAPVEVSQQVARQLPRPVETESDPVPISVVVDAAEVHARGSQFLRLLLEESLDPFLPTGRHVPSDVVREEVAARDREQDRVAPHVIPELSYEGPLVIDRVDAEHDHGVLALPDEAHLLPEDLGHFVRGGECLELGVSRRSIVFGIVPERLAARTVSPVFDFANFQFLLLFVPVSAARGFEAHGDALVGSAALATALATADVVRSSADDIRSLNLLFALLDDCGATTVAVFGGTLILRDRNGFQGALFDRRRFFAMSMWFLMAIPATTDERGSSYASLADTDTRIPNTVFPAYVESSSAPTSGISPSS
mmetsp:Transcript_9188/g.16967  ORF Transcript_9188/g.16967 Transcript_9188/m.16967 type:complete len:548 (-) Transcript_9188:94-1737(-)